MKTKHTLTYIPERHNLVNLLECLCNKYNIKIHNIGKYIENNNDDDDNFLEDYMSDSTHYSNYIIPKIKCFIFLQVYFKKNTYNFDYLRPN